MYFQSIAHKTQQSRGACYFSIGSVHSTHPCANPWPAEAEVADHVLSIEEKSNKSPQLKTSKIGQQQYSKVLCLWKTTKFYCLASLKDNTLQCYCWTSCSTMCQLHIFVDKMHFKGHVDSWCEKHCYPYFEHKDLDKASVAASTSNKDSLHTISVLQVNTEVCEWIFSWLSRYARITHSF